MRRIKEGEIAVLVASLAIGGGNANADETPADNMATVTITSAVNIPPYFTYAIGPIIGANQPDLTGNFSSSTQASNSHAMQCALAYDKATKTNNFPFVVGPHGGWETFMTNQYGWTDDAKNAQVTATAALPTTPPVGVWHVTYGLTTPKYSNPFFFGVTNIFVRNIGSNTALLINTLAHEWAHQWGADEDQADAAGNAVQQAWQNDHGAACGGL
jgi:hypothetical protein